VRERQGALRSLRLHGEEMTKEEFGDLIAGALFALVAIMGMFI
jgi:hypothetical protein